MRPKPLLTLTVALILAVWLAGCRGRPATPTATAATLAPPSPTPALSPLPTPTLAPTVVSGKPAVALLTSGPVDDGGWNQAAFEGLKRLEEQGATIAHSQNVAADDQNNLLQAYAEGGFDIIIGHGAEFGPALMAVAQEYPDARFLQIGGTASNPGNLASFRFRPGEAAYAAGVLAGLMAESGRLGGLGTVESPAGAADFVAFEQAARAVNPAVAGLPVIYAGADAARTKDAAINLFESGSELLLAQAGVEAAVVSEAASEVSEEASLIGWSYRPGPPPAKPGIAIIRQKVAEVIVAAVAAMVTGEMDWSSHTVGFAEGVQSLAPYASAVPAQVADEMDAVIQALIDGRITLDEGGHVIEDDYHPKDSNNA